MASVLRDSYEASLLYDGVLVFSQSMRNIFEQEDMIMPDVDCRDSEAAYEQGKEILDEMNKVSKKRKSVRYNIPNKIEYILRRNKLKSKMTFIKN